MAAHYPFCNSAQFTYARRRARVRPARPQCAERTRGAACSPLGRCRRQSQWPRDTPPAGTTSTAGATPMMTTTLRATARPGHEAVAADSGEESRHSQPRMVATTSMKTTRRPSSLRADARCDRRRAACRRTLTLAACAHWLRVRHLCHRPTTIRRAAATEAQPRSSTGCPHRHWRLRSRSHCHHRPHPRSDRVRIAPRPRAH